MKLSTGRNALVALAVTVAAAAAAAPAGAAGLTATPPDCTEALLSQPFAQWGDHARYSRLPDGGFESGAQGWTLSRGAKVVDDQEPWTVGGKADTHALELPAGASAVSPVVCAGLSEPTVRMFARTNGALAVSVRTKTILGLTLTLPVGAALGSDWQPTLPFLVGANLLALGGKAPVQFVVTSLAGTGHVDDVYLDPRRMR